MRLSLPILLLASLLCMTSCNPQNLEDDIADIETCDWIQTPEVPATWNFEVLPMGNTNSYYQIDFLDAQTGYAMGGTYAIGNTCISKTMDGGYNWTSLDLEIDAPAMAFDFANANVGYCSILNTDPCNGNTCPNFPIIYKTQDAGENWERKDYPQLEGYFSAIHFDNTELGFALLSTDLSQALPIPNTIILRSQDGGNSWDSLLSSNSSLELDPYSHVLEIYNEKIYLAGNLGQLVVVDKDGQGAFEIQTNLSQISRVQLLSDEKVIVEGPEGVFLTLNAGQSWESVIAGPGRLVHFFDEQNGIAILNHDFCEADPSHSYDAIAVTNDGAQNWIEGNPASNLIFDLQNIVQLGPNQSYFLLGNYMVTAHR